MLIRQLLEASGDSLFERYHGLPSDGAGSPKRTVPASEAWRLGEYWTEPVLVPLRELADVRARAISSSRSRDVRRALIDLPPIEVIVWRNGNAELFDGNHRLVAARGSGASSIEARFTFPDL